MKRRPRILDLLAAGSLLLCAAVVVMWIASSPWHPSLTYHSDLGLCRATSEGGSIVFYQPPAASVDETVAIDFVSRMSNNDFDWTAPAKSEGEWYVRGDVRAGTGTLDLFGYINSHPRFPWPPNARLLLSSLEDPHKIVPANMMLLFITGRGRMANMWPDTRLPYVFMLSNGKDAAPDLSRASEIIAQWHQEFDEPIGHIHDGWLLAVAMFFPFFWLTRPNRKSAHKPTLGRWVFNSAALASVLACIVLCVLWCLSYSSGTEWMMPLRAAAAPALPPGAPPVTGSWITLRRFGYADGRIQFLRETHVGTIPVGNGNPTLLWALSNPREVQSTSRGAPASGNWLTSSIQYTSAPLKLMAAARGRGTIPTIFIAPPGQSSAGRGPNRAPVAQPRPATLPEAQQVESVNANLKAMVGRIAQNAQNPSAAQTQPAEKDFTQLQQEIAQIQRMQLAVANQETGRPPWGDPSASRAAANISGPGLVISGPSTVGSVASAGPRSVGMRLPSSQISRAPPRLTGSSTQLIISFWVLILPTLLLPAAWLWSTRRRAILSRPYTCRGCGYDLRATPNRCPECGTVPAGLSP
ncbi:MAG TPA: hypothetical protein VH370_06265 [Humisphaera sp.]|nr:hypothetical protein [Humisphaera sp.]